MSDADDWQRIWDARLDALERILGPSGDAVYHAPHPFELGGNADVVAFPKHLAGFVYVTAELTGKPDACYADYELAICHRVHDDWGPNVISRLAPYTQQARIETRQSMDVGDATPASSQIKAFLFDTYATFDMFGRTWDLRLCIGITKAELAFKMERGAEPVLALLKQHGVYPFTDLTRASVPLG